MKSIMDWLAMGGYSHYVWSAYGLVGFVLLATVIGCQRQKRRIHRQLKHWFKQMAR